MYLDSLMVFGDDSVDALKTLVGRYIVPVLSINFPLSAPFPLALTNQIKGYHPVLAGGFPK